MFIQTYKWTEGKDEGSMTDEAIRFQTAEGLQIVADIGVTFKFNNEAGTIRNLFLKYRRGVEEIIDALNAKVEATQIAIQRENEVRTAEAEAQKKIAEARGKAESILLEAKAQAETNRLLSQSITANLIEVKRIEKWDGKYPTVMGSGTIMDMRGLIK